MTKSRIIELFEHCESKKRGDSHPTIEERREAIITVLRNKSLCPFSPMNDNTLSDLHTIEEVLGIDIYTDYQEEGGAA